MPKQKPATPTPAPAAELRPLDITPSDRDDAPRGRWSSTYDPERGSWEPETARKRQ